jgi:hypothetical protein
MDSGRDLTPGASISNAKHDHVCRCGQVVMLGQVYDHTGTLKWRNFERQPVERYPHRYYRRHFCAKTEQAPAR